MKLRFDNRQKDYANFVLNGIPWVMRSGCSREYYLGAVITTYAGQIGAVNDFITSRVVKILFL